MRVNRKGKILVVDDNEPMRYSVARLAQTGGHEVIEAATGEECLAAVREQKPDLVLLDVRLPGIQGTEVLQRIKADPQIASTFVVHLSAHMRDPVSMSAALRAGADGYLAHPIDNEELLARIDAFVRHKHALDELQKSEARYRSLFDHNPQAALVFDRESGKILKANPAAAELYTFPVQELERMRLDEIQEGSQPSGGLKAERRTHRGAHGRSIPVEIRTHTVDWGGQPACAMVVTDLTARIELDQERALQREGYEGELRSLAQLAENRQTAVTSALAGAISLPSRSPEIAEEIISEYEELLDPALEARIFRVDPRLGAKLRPIAERLVQLHAGPRDVVHIHYQAVTRKTAKAPFPKARGYMEAGRMLLIELLGLLVAAYRLQSIKERPAPSQPA